MEGYAGNSLLVPSQLAPSITLILSRLQCPGRAWEQLEHRNPGAVLPKNSIFVLLCPLSETVIQSPFRSIPNAPGAMMRDQIRVALGLLLFDGVVQEEVNEDSIYLRSWVLALNLSAK